MALTKNLDAYKHVQQVLDAALPHKRVVYTLGTQSEAIRWRQEAYYYRTLLSDAKQPKYLDYIIKLDQNKVIIEKKAVEGFLTVDGEHLAPAEATTQPSEAEKFAFDLAHKLGLDVEE